MAIFPGGLDRGNAAAIPHFADCLDECLGRALFAQLPERAIMYSQHEERRVSIDATPDRVFAALDDPTRMTSHMSETSWHMGGGRMETVVDSAHGQQVGSHIILRGRAFGIRLFVEEVVTEREPPTRKAWETIGTPRLLVIGSYCMWFEVTPCPAGAVLCVGIDYQLPASGVDRVLGWLFGRAYARWCVRQMTGGAVNLFASQLGSA